MTAGADDPSQTPRLARRSGDSSKRVVKLPWRSLERYHQPTFVPSISHDTTLGSPSPPTPRRLFSFSFPRRTLERLGHPASVERQLRLGSFGPVVLEDSSQPCGCRQKRSAAGDSRIVEAFSSRALLVDSPPAPICVPLLLSAPAPTPEPRKGRWASPVPSSAAGTALLLHPPPIGAGLPSLAAVALSQLWRGTQSWNCQRTTTPLSGLRRRARGAPRAPPSRSLLPSVLLSRPALRQPGSPTRTPPVT